MIQIFQFFENLNNVLDYEIPKQSERECIIGVVTGQDAVHQTNVENLAI